MIETVFFLLGLGIIESSLALFNYVPWPKALSDTLFVGGFYIIIQTITRNL